MTRTKASFLFAIPAAVALLLCLVFPKESAEGVKTGFAIANEMALPALFPALVLSRILCSLIGKRRGKGVLFLPLILGLFCGFPVGAKVVAELVREGSVSRRDGEKMLFFTNNAGPSFLISLCGSKLMGNAFYGWILFFWEAVLAVLSFLFFFGRKIKALPSFAAENEISPSFSTVFTNSLKDAVYGFLYIFSCILFFSFLGNLLIPPLSLPPVLQSVLKLFLELTSGIASLEGTKEIVFPLCAAGVGFGGLSVYAQTAGIAKESDLSLKFYLLGRCFFAAVLFCLAEIFIKCL